MASQEWAKLSEDEKGMYHDQCEVKKQKYRKEMDEYKKLQSAKNPGLEGSRASESTSRDRPNNARQQPTRSLPAGVPSSLQLYACRD